MRNIPAVENYFAAIPEPRRSELRQFHECILTNAPNLRPYIEGTFLGYGQYHYRYKSGREGNWFTVGLGNNKHSLAVYVTCTKNGAYLTEKYTELLRASIGKSCIRFKKIEDVDWDVLGQLLREAAAAYKPEQIA